MYDVCVQVQVLGVLVGYSMGVQVHVPGAWVRQDVYVSRFMCSDPGLDMVYVCLEVQDLVCPGSVS